MKGLVATTSAWARCRFMDANAASIPSGVPTACSMSVTPSFFAAGAGAGAFSGSLILKETRVPQRG